VLQLAVQILRLLGRVVLLGLVKKEVGRQFFVLVACKVSLDGLVSWKAKTAKLCLVSATDS
jgi:threonine dehydrogenase-like Zn-dependent dehydrogenase